MEREGGERHQGDHRANPLEVGCATRGTYFYDRCKWMFAKNLIFPIHQGKSPYEIEGRIRQFQDKEAETQGFLRKLGVG